MSTTLVLSVPHTGTRFVLRQLFDEHNNPDVVNWHINENIKLLGEKIAEFDQVIVPLRDPMQTALSWKRREERLGPRMDKLTRRLEILATFVDELKPWWIPIDTDDRDTHIGAINAGLGLDLDPGDWSRIGHFQKNQDAELTDDERELVQACLDKHQAFFGRWYP